MLTINLLPWRDYAKAKQKKIFKIMTLMTLIASIIIYHSIYQYLQFKVRDVDERIVVLTKKLEKHVYKTDNGLTELHKLVNKIRSHQDQLKKLLHAMFIHSTIVWDSIEIQKGIIKIQGVAQLMSLLLSFINDCDKQFNFNLIIKSIKILSPLHAVQFQVQTDKNDGLD